MLNSKTLHCHSCSHQQEVPCITQAYLKSPKERLPLDSFAAEIQLIEEGTTLHQASREGKLLLVTTTICPHCGHMGERAKLDYRPSIIQIGIVIVSSCLLALLVTFAIAQFAPKAIIFFAPLAGFLSAFASTLLATRHWKKSELALEKQFQLRTKLLEKNSCSHCQRTRLLDLTDPIEEKLTCTECGEKEVTMGY